MTVGVLLAVTDSYKDHLYIKHMVIKIKLSNNAADTNNLQLPAAADCIVIR
jgi:hypothetical protein